MPGHDGSTACRTVGQHARGHFQPVLVPPAGSVTGLQRPVPELILASASSARRALLVAAALNFTVKPADIDEGTVKREARAAGADAAATALRLAELKAQVVAQDNRESLVIGADQLLVCDDVWFDKPADVSSAAEQLRRLRGRTHELITAATCYQGDTRLWHHVVAPRLAMRHFSDGFLDAYLEHEKDAVTTSVGGYRLEGLGVHLFDAIEGEHSAILGLPMLALLRFLRQRRLLVA
jgi:septum formation protein